jgi:hypothetical protein
VDAGATRPIHLVSSAAKHFPMGVVTSVSDDGKTLSFDPATGFIQFHGSQSKSTIRYDPQTQRYWSLVQKITNPQAGYSRENSPYHQRNVLMLTSSANLGTWREEQIILRYRDGQVIKNDSGYGFQYVDWQFDGDDLIAVSRTAWAAHNYHDANFLTFHRIQNFRSQRETEAPPDLAAGR